ncbi:MAG: hypothetical protein AAF696_29840, partial [Bacteroidota bacterium]
VNLGSENGYHLIVPDKTDAGQVYLNSCNFSLQKTCTEDTLTVCQGDIFKYVSMQEGVNQTPEQSLQLNIGDVLVPEFSPGGVTYMDVSGNGAPATFLRLSKNYGNGKEFPAGYRLIIRCSSSTNYISLRNGYYGPIATGIETLSGSDLNLFGNEYATFVYTKNYWVEVSNTSSAKRKSLQISSNTADKIYFKEKGLEKNGLLDFNIPAGYKISSLVAESNGAKGSLKINVGTKPLGDEVLKGGKVKQKALTDFSLNKNLFSLHQEQRLYVSSKNWAGAKLDLYVVVERVK